MNAYAQTQQLKPPPIRAVAQPPLLAGGASIDLAVPLYQSRVVTVVNPAQRVSVANPDVADIVVISPTELYVLGKDLGTTNVLLWDRDNHLIGAIMVEVQHDIDSLRRKLAELLPGQPIEARASQRSIVLSGRVSDAEAMNAAVRIASTFLAQVQTAKQTEQFQQGNGSRREDKTVGDVINLLQIGGAQQVMLEVKVAEIARTEVMSLDLQFNSIARGLGNWNVGGVNGGATFPTGFLQPPNSLLPSPYNTLPLFTPNAGTVTSALSNNGVVSPFGAATTQFLPSTQTITNQGLFATFLDKNFLFNMALDASKQKGLARILAEPTLTTLSGQEATFLSGGEFPIPVPQSLGQVTIQFKQYGVSVKFLPVVLNSGHINLSLNLTVSELASNNTVTVAVPGSSASYTIPSLTERSAAGTVELGDGQTIGLAGLLNSTTASQVTKFPGLGSIPILGALFRSQNYQKGETELVILVTPRLA
ncbi:MAG TPA: pilus assembly protein N-terminal domain-containing protein, partial [Steroidobacteraceae bacterium]